MKSSGPGLALVGAPCYLGYEISGPINCGAFVASWATIALLRKANKFLLYACWLLLSDNGIYIIDHIIDFFIWNFSIVCWKQSKAVPIHATEALGGEEYSSYSFSTSALDGGEWPASRPGLALPPGKGPPVPIVQEAEWTPEPVWTQRLEEKSFAPSGDRTSITRSSSP
jgi:hypothetical protein